MPRAGLTSERVVDVALALVDERGIDEVTLAAVADAAGVRTPSLYKHVASLADLHERLAVRALDDLTDTLTRAVHGREGEDGLVALMYAHRDWAGRHPRRYALVPVTAPDPGSSLAAAAARFVALADAVVGPLVPEAGATIHAVRVVRSAVHGFASIDSAGGFGLPVSVEESFDALVAIVVAGVRTASGMVNGR